ncbi:MAG: TMEM165/GDT1 family protein [Candidatus Thorarchaeota archaeon]
MFEFLQTALIAATLIFLMELGDKTQIAAFALSARFRRPKMVFAGVLAGLALVSLIAIFIGSLLRDILPSNVLSWLLGTGFIFIGILTILNRRKPDSTPEEYIDQCPIPEEDCPSHKKACMSQPEECPIYITEVLGKGAFSRSFTIIFAAELGDKTWITVLVLATRFDPVCVLLGSIAAFAVVNGIGIILGQHLAEKVPKKKLSIIVGVSLIFVGLMILGLQYL